MLHFWQSANNSSTLFREVVVAPLVFMLLPICLFVTFLCKLEQTCGEFGFWSFCFNVAFMFMCLCCVFLLNNLCWAWIFMMQLCFFVKEPTVSLDFCSHDAFMFMLCLLLKNLEWAWPFRITTARLIPTPFFSTAAAVHPLEWQYFWQRWYFLVTPEKVLSTKGR